VTSPRRRDERVEGSEGFGPTKLLGPEVVTKQITYPPNLPYLPNLPPSLSSKKKKGIIKNRGLEGT
jgi:hypothetical protein